MHLVLFLTPSFLAGDFKILPTWLQLLVESDWVPGLLNLGLWLMPFAVTLVGLHLILFKPMMNYLAERHEQTDGARQEAQAINARVTERMETLNLRLAEARNEAGQLRATARANAAKQGQILMDAARAEAESQVASAIRRIQVERDTAAQALKQTATSLSSDIAGQILGRSLQA
jgi:F-type H+-transporting ATPase subunit b